MTEPASLTTSSPAVGAAAVASRAEALARLTSFAREGAALYSKRRNYDYGPDDRSNVSMLSPYLARRLILESEVLTSVLGFHPYERVEKFVQEVFWRTYFKGWLERRPAVWYAYVADVRRLARSLDEDRDLRRRYDEAVAGRTGIDCFDAWVGELVDDGYLHNHARMWFASIWIFTLRLPWQLGADLFLRHLLDGDAASNTLGWRWVGGLHTRGKTYLARAANIRKYTGGRFSAGRQLAMAAPPLGEAPLPAPVDIDAGDRIPAGSRYGLLLTEEDGYAESLALPQPPAAALSLWDVAARSPLPVSARVRRYSAAAVADAAGRIEGAFGLQVGVHESTDWPRDLLGWALYNGLERVVTAAPAQGPVNDRLAFAERRLADHGVRLLRLRRGYDLRAWPYASKGFFKLRQRIPELLDALKD